jgi:hypothetical protein
MRDLLLFLLLLYAIKYYKEWDNIRTYLSGSTPAERNADFIEVTRTEGLLEKYPP